MADAVLISTAEFTLKSHIVRHMLIRLLKRHLRFNLKRVGRENCKIRLAGGFIVLENFEDADVVARELAMTFGVAHADACERARSNLEEVVDHTASLAEQKLKRGETFAVRAHRFEPSHIKGKEIEVRAGSEVISRLPYAKVNLDRPDRTFRVFFGASDAFVSETRFDGPGGLPVGSQGKLLGEANDPTHGPLAFYLLMKRGAMVSPVIPVSDQLLGQRQLEEILGGIAKLRPFVPKKAFQADLIRPDDYLAELLEDVDRPLQRAFSIRLAWRALAHLALASGALGLVTGDRLGHDGLESLKDLKIIDDVVKLPIFRPLLTADEESVDRQLRETGLLSTTRTIAGVVGRVALSGDSIGDLRALEERLNVEQIAQRIAANATSVAI